MRHYNLSLFNLLVLILNSHLIITYVAIFTRFTVSELLLGL